MAEKKPTKGAGRKADSGNVVVDLGEKHSQRIEKMVNEKMSAAGLAGRTGARSSFLSASRPGLQRPGGGYRPGTFGGYRPGMFGGSRQGGYAPWYSKFGGGGGKLGQEAASMAFPARWSLIPQALMQVKTTELLTGAGLGLVGNRALMRLTPMLWQTNKSMLVHEGMAFIAGLIPLAFKRNATTIGVAIPGAVYLGGSLIDMLFDWLKMPKAELKGADGAQRIGGDAAMAARQKLAAIQQRINQPQQQVPRVVARQYA